MSTKKRCREAVREAVGPDIDQGFVDRVVDDLLKMKKKAQAEGKDFSKMAEHQRRKTLRSIKQRQIISATNLSKTSQRINFYNDFVGDATGKKKGQLLREAFISRLSNTFVNRRGAGLSAEQMGKTAVQKYQRMLLYGLKKNGYFAMTKKGALDREIAIELYEKRRGGSPGRSGSKEAREIADLIHKVQNSMRNDLRRAGVPVDDLDGYIFKQAHERDKILSLHDDPDKAKRLWAEKVLPMVDQDRMFGLDKTQDERLNVLVDIADTLVSGRNNKADHLVGASDELITTASYKSITKDLLEERVLHFKDGETFHNYNMEFGKNSLFEAINQSIQTNGRAFGAISVFGTKPEAAIKADLERIRKIIGDDVEASKGFGDAADFSDKLIPQVMGFDMQYSDSLLAKSSAAYRGLNNVFLLGKAAIWSISDLATSASQISQVTGDNFISSQINVVTDIVKQIPGAYRGEITEAMGVYIDDMMALNYSRLGLTDVDDFAPGWAKKAQQYSFMYSGLNWVTNVARNATAMSISRSIAKRANLPFDKLDPSMQQSLKNFGIGADEWAEVVKGVRTIESGDKIIGSEQITNLDVAERFQSFLDAAAEMGSPEPSARAKARLLNGTKPGTFWGEMLRAFAQFKSFPVFMHDIVLKTANAQPGKDVLSGRDLVKDLATGQANYKHISQLVISTTLMAYMADTLVGLTEGKGPKDPTDPNTWRDAFVRGGSAGLLGDLLLTDHGRYGGSATESLAGPTFGRAEKLRKITYDALEGKDVDRRAFDFVFKDHAPNLFYLKTGLDHLILDDLRETMEPGYKAKKRQRQFDENRDKLF